ncbi:hypothetical protein BS17DRAFT_759688 [Gyrodon lividus]|nr:hypothetical protein BS17DRAFT_759688 [Gyrodon lividus]
MAYRKISRNIKLAAIHLYECGLLEPRDILHVCALSSYGILKLWHETGDVVKPQDNNLRGHPRIIDHEDIKYLVQLIHQKPNYFLDELLCLLHTNQFISVHYSIIHQELERAGMSHKKLKKIAIERNEDLHAEFIACMAQYDPSNLSFIDEVSRGEHTLSCHYGRLKQGKCVEKESLCIRFCSEVLKG